MGRLRDERTLDLLGWQPPDLVQRYDAERVRTATLRARIARAVSETLKDHDGSREAVAELMSAFLDEDVTKNMLDAYASEARTEHSIPYLRLLALVHVTGDTRLLSLGAEMFGFAVIDEKYVAAVEEAMWTAEEEHAAKMKRAKRRQWSGR